MDTAMRLVGECGESGAERWQKMTRQSRIHRKRVEIEKEFKWIFREYDRQASKRPYLVEHNARRNRYRMRYKWGRLGGGETDEEKC